MYIYIYMIYVLVNIKPLTYLMKSSPLPMVTQVGLQVEYSTAYPTLVLSQGWKQAKGR